jgi:hypothetical protein
MTTAVETLPTPADFDDSVIHYFCGCDPDRGLCGADLTGVEETETVEPEQLCIVCHHLYRRQAHVCQPA